MLNEETFFFLNLCFAPAVPDTIAIPTFDECWLGAAGMPIVYIFCYCG